VNTTPGNSQQSPSILDITSSQSTYDAISQIIPVGVLLVDQKGNICNANNQARELFDYGDDIIGLGVEALVPQDVREHHAAYRETYNKQPNTRLMASSNKLVGLRKDNSIIAIEVGLSPAQMNGVSYTVVTITDVSEQRQIVSELELRQQTQNKLLDNLSETNQKMERFAYICSHDLQEPIRTAASFSQLLKTHLVNSQDSKAESYLTFIEDNCARALRLIQGFKAYEKINTESLPAEHVDLNDLVLKIKTKLEANDDRCRIIIDSLPELNASPDQLNLLFSELIKNAVRFNHSDLPTVEIDSSEDQHNFIISVRDNGIAIKPEHRQSIFELFYRLDRSSNLQGEGIGLTLCKEITERNGATIAVEDDELYTKAFVIRWPR